jgi:hypothetical protein
MSDKPLEPLPIPTDEELDAAITEMLAEVGKMIHLIVPLWQQIVPTQFAVAKAESLYLRAADRLTGCTLQDGLTLAGLHPKIEDVIRRLGQMHDLGMPGIGELRYVSASLLSLHQRVRGRAKETAILRGEFDFGLLPDSHA